MWLLATIMLPYTVNREVFNVLTGFLWWSHKGWHKLPVSRSWGGLLSPPPPPSMSCQSAGWLEGRWYPSSSKNLAISCLQCQLIEPCFWHSITFQPRSFSPMAEVWKHTSLNTNPPKPPPRWVGQAPSGPRAICNFSWQSVPKTYPSHPRGYRHPSLNRPMAGLHAGANLQDKASPTLSLAKLAWRQKMHALNWKI